MAAIFGQFPANFLEPCSASASASASALRITLIAEKPNIYYDSIFSTISTLTSVVSSFILYLVPLTVTTIALILNSRRQTEHFMKVQEQD